MNSCGWRRQEIQQIGEGGIGRRRSGGKRHRIGVFLCASSAPGDTQTKSGQSVIQEEGLSMLVLTRKNNEAVMVGGARGFERMLKITVLEIIGGKVRLGFEVDREVPVHRWEVWERLRAIGRPDSPTEGPVAPVQG
jgi:carbon storage regulator CsrA